MYALPAQEPIALTTVGDAAPITLATYDLGSGPPVVFCHGFPDLAFGWRNQLVAVADAGFRAIAPDQRGYGGSSAPPHVTDYDLDALTGDLVGLLDALEIEQAFFVGHDWGGFVAWAMPVLHPDRVLGVAGLCTPYIAFPGIERHLAIVDGEVERQYVAWFQERDIPEAEMDPQVRTILGAILRSAPPLEEAFNAAFTDGKLNMNPFLNPQEWPVLGDPLGTPSDFEHYCTEYERAGFRGGINWYRNIDRNATAHPELGVQPLDIPCLMMTAELDPALRPEFADGMPELCSDLEMYLVEGVGHWAQQEKPEVVSGHLIDWLTRVVG
jgi:pimeloyl-ACP methyl ester carboxylesterase